MAPSAPEMTSGWPEPPPPLPPTYEQEMEERIMWDMTRRVREVLIARDTLLNRATSRMEQRLANLIREELRAHMDEFHAAQQERWANTTF